MASVKWIKEITVIDQEYNGPFQTIDYVYYPYKETDAEKFSVTVMNVNSTIQKPLNLLDTGIHLIKGIAWTGIGTITKVEISLDEGYTWNSCSLEVPI
ncbi:hypothetical protein [Metabacillus sp. RGM 3146]|uniref:hypothetical protein n=1 Tax=Metabacillus sp. RGM 3146 TaxID=3401092 RepID=UPI003B99CC47